jgi:hypothetical protein
LSNSRHRMLTREARPFKDTDERGLKTRISVNDL